MRPGGDLFNSHQRAAYYLMRLGILAGVMVLVLAQLPLWSHVSDDSYISFRYVERFLGGHGLTYNDGERVEGFSHPLWVVLLSITGRGSHVDVSQRARALGFGLTVLTLFVVLGLARRGAVTRVDGRAIVIAVVMILVFPGTHVYATAGLETPLLGFLLLVGAALSFMRFPTAAALSFGLAGMTRPEGLLYGLLWWGSTIRFRLKERKDLWPESYRVAVLLAPAVVYEIFRVAYFNAWAPNPFLAKPPGTFGGPFGLAYLWQGLSAAGGPLVLGMVIWAMSSRIDRANVAWHAVGPIVGSVIFIAYSWGDWMPFGRFIAPVWPLVAIVVGSSIVLFATSLGRFVVSVRQETVMAMLALCVVVSTVGTYAPDIKRYMLNEGLSSMVMRGRDQILAGKWLSEHLWPGATVATGRIGGISYAAPECVFWDEKGLTDREQALWISRGRPGGDSENPVYLRQPDVVAATEVPASWSYSQNEFVRSYLDDSYELVTKIPQGNYGEFHIWVRRSAMDQFLARSPLSER